MGQKVFAFNIVLNHNTGQIKIKIILTEFNSINNNICVEQLHKNLLTTKSSDRMTVFSGDHIIAQVNICFV